MMRTIGIGEISADLDECQLSIVRYARISRVILVWLSSLYWDQLSWTVSIPESESHE